MPRMPVSSWFWWYEVGPCVAPPSDIVEQVYDQTVGAVGVCFNAEMGDEDVYCCAISVGAVDKYGVAVLLDGVVSAGNLFVSVLPVCYCCFVHQVDGCGCCCNVWYLGDAMQ